MLLVIPIDAQNAKAPIASWRQPDLFNRARACDICHLEGLAGLDNDRRRNLPALTQIAGTGRTATGFGHAAPALFTGKILGADRTRLRIGERR